MMKHLTSSTIFCNFSQLMPVWSSISADQSCILCKFLPASTRLAAASSDGLYIRRDASNKAISYRYCAKNKIFWVSVEMADNFT